MSEMQDVFPKAIDGKPREIIAQVLMDPDEFADAPASVRERYLFTADWITHDLAKEGYVIVEKARWDVIANAAHDWAIECNEWAADRAADIRDALDGLYPKP